MIRADRMVKAQIINCSKQGRARDLPKIKKLSFESDFWVLSKHVQAFKWKNRDISPNRTSSNKKCTPSHKMRGAGRGSHQAALACLHEYTACRASSARHGNIIGKVFQRNASSTELSPPGNALEKPPLCIRGLGKRGCKWGCSHYHPDWH